MENKGKRLSTFDLVRGICMLSVVGCHFDEGLFRKINFTFNLPAFFLIGGFFYSVNRGRLKDRTVRMLKPYVFSVLLIAAVDTLKVPAGALLRGYDFPVLQTMWERFRYWLLAGLYGSGLRIDFFSLRLPYIGAIWFLLAHIWNMVFMELTWAGTKRLPEEKRPLALMIVSVVLFVLGWWSAKFTWLPLSVQAACCSFFLFALGYVLKPHLPALLHNRKAMLLCGFLWAVQLAHSIVKGHMDMVRCLYPFFLMELIGGAGGDLLLLAGGDRWERSGKFVKLRKFFEWIGRNTLPFLCFHLVEMSIVPWQRLDALGLNYVLENAIIFNLKVVWGVFWVYVVNRVKPLRKIFF